MPMNVPDSPDERAGLLAFLGQQRDAVRIAAYGLTEEQARKTTTGSTLSVGGLVKHVTSAERNWIDKVLDCDTSDPTDYSAYVAGFHMTPDETLAGLLGLYEEQARRTDAAIAAVADLGRPVPLPTGVPWFPESASVRWVLLHLIEETARHAGHADIIRESLDGATAGSLMAAVEGWEPTPWVQPWKPSA
ncbi:MAG TPA: DinB family protein [Acidimicrobiales bacterium]